MPTETCKLVKADRCRHCYFLGCPCAGPGVCGCACHKTIKADEGAYTDAH